MNDPDPGEANHSDAAADGPGKIGGSRVDGDVSVRNGTFAGHDINIKNLEVGDVTQILEVLLKYLPETYLKRPEQLDQMFANFQNIHAELREWKELHNYLDTTIQYYDQFWDALGNANQRAANLANLRNSWLKISMVLDQLLRWAGSIEYIGRKYSVSRDGNLSGEDWAIKLELTRHEIETTMSNLQKVVESASPLAFLKNVLGFSGPMEYHLGLLQENASNYRTLVYGYMHWADNKLREAATKLVEFSENILRRSA